MTGYRNWGEKREERCSGARNRVWGAMSIVALSTLSLSLLMAAQGVKSQPGPPNTKHQTPLLAASDVMATVEGYTITRRELTYFWLSTDRQASHKAGDLLIDRWRAAKGSMPSYTVSEAAIYARLYGNPGKEPAYANILSNMVTTHLVAIEANRKHIVVMPQEARAAAHEMLDQVRKQQQLNLSDEEILVQFNVPRDIFMEDMAYRLRMERLLALDYAKRNGRAITADERANWKQIVEAQKADYLTRLRHNAHITSVIPLPESGTTPAAQGSAETPPPPPNVKQQ
jgi:hypothetical protein